MPSTGRAADGRPSRIRRRFSVGSSAAARSATRSWKRRASTGLTRVPKQVAAGSAIYTDALGSHCDLGDDYTREVVDHAVTYISMPKKRTPTRTPENGRTSEEYDRFVRLTRDLLHVPKREIKEREKKSR